MWHYSPSAKCAAGHAGPNGGGRGARGGGGGGHLRVELLAPVCGAAVAEGADTLPGLGDVEGAAGAGVRHGDVAQTVLAAAPQQLLLVVALCSHREGAQETTNETPNKTRSWLS